MPLIASVASRVPSSHRRTPELTPKASFGLVWRPSAGPGRRVYPWPDIGGARPLDICARRGSARLHLVKLEIRDQMLLFENLAASALETPRAYATRERRMMWQLRTGFASHFVVARRL